MKKTCLCVVTLLLTASLRADDKIDIQVVKFDGRPFSEDEVVVALEHAVAGGAERMIVSEGKIVPPEYGVEEFAQMLELRNKRPKMSAPMVPLPPGYNK